MTAARAAVVAVVESAVRAEAGPGAGAPPEAAVERLRARLAGTTAREHVVLDFLADDLREARGALASVAAWMARVEQALSEDGPTAQQLLALAQRGGAAERIEYLADQLDGVRRRLAQVAARME